jgi:hypothetical protein
VLESQTGKPVLSGENFLAQDKVAKKMGPIKTVTSKA